MRFECGIVPRTNLMLMLLLLSFLVLLTGCDEPDIDYFLPTSGFVGDSVEIYGKNFNYANLQVYFNGTEAEIRSRSRASNSAFTLKVYVPSGATTGKITVTSGTKSGTSESDFIVISPEITGFSPDNGQVGDTVIITGTNFSTTPSSNEVKFNNTSATVTASTATQITTTVPAGATTGKITVTCNGGTATSGTDFTVEETPADTTPEITGFSPDNGQEGDTVIISGTNFSTTPSSNEVKFNNTSATVTASTATQITTTVPAGATTGKITVTIGEDTATSSADFTVNSSVTQPVFGGQYEDGDSTLPCYWTGTERVDLPITSSHGWALSPAVVAGSTVYVAGRYYDSDNHRYTPCYWDGSESPHVLPLPEDVYSFQISGIAVSNGTVYTVGSYDYQLDADTNVTVPCIWTNTGDPQLLTDPLEIGSAWTYAITVSGGTTYVAGKYLDPETSEYKACYWEGITLVDLSSPAVSTDIYATGITVSGGKVYTSGTYYIYLEGITNQKACYWIDDEIFILDSPEGSLGEGSYASSIAVSGEDIYVSGRYYADSVDTACYWKNGDLTAVTAPEGGSIEQYSSSITVIGDDVYIGGGYQYENDYGYSWRACFWTNDDSITDLNETGQNSHINSSMWWWD